MSFHSMLIADHLNKNRAGKPALLRVPDDRMPARLRAEKMAIALICMGYGLIRFPDNRSDRHE